MSYPYLKYSSSIEEEPNLLKLFIDDSEVTIETNEPEQLRKTMLCMDGTKSIHTLAAENSYSQNDFESLLSQLKSVGAIEILDKNDTLTVEPQAFAKICRQVFPQWKKDVFTLDFWHYLTSGQLSISSFAGWMLENFHFIEGATKRLSLVTATSNKNRKIRELFSQHFIEEYNHQLFFLKALQRLGFSKSQVLNHTPLPSTQAIINHMRESARTDTIAYAACSAFLESTGGDRKDGMLFYDALTKHYDKEQKGIIKPLVDHAFLDEEYGHNDWLEKVCSCVAVLDKERSDEALSAAQMLVETLKMWTWDMSVHYENIPFEELTNACRYR